MTTIRTLPVTDVSAWRGAALRNDSTWIVPLTGAQRAEVLAALESVRRRGLPLPRITRADFALPSWAGLFSQLLHDIRDGRGFSVLRGLPFEGLTEDEAGRMLWGIGTHMGVGVTQNAAAELIAHVYDRGGRYGDRNVRAYQVRADLSPHCDQSDVVALACLRKARSGGLTRLASAMSVFNVMLRESPQHLPILFGGLFYSRKGEQGPDEPRVNPRRLPVFSEKDGVLSCRYMRSWVEYARMHDGVAMTQAETAALDAFDAIARSGDLPLDMMLEPGDVQFANNFTVLHARTEYEDDPAHKRHMLRLWLEVDGLRPLASEDMRHGHIRHGRLGRTAEAILQ